MWLVSMPVASNLLQICAVAVDLKLHVCLLHSQGFQGAERGGGPATRNAVELIDFAACRRIQASLH